MSLSVLATVFGVIFLAELPDKSLFASLVLGMRFRGRDVWVGVAAAFLLHVAIAVSAGQLLTLLPQTTVEAVVAALFLAGGLYLLVGSEQKEEQRGAAAGAVDPLTAPTFTRVALTSFSVVFVGEWGDITQIVTANYAARFDDALAVGVGATAALWSVAALAIGVGSKLLDYVSVVLARRVTGLILLGFASYTALSAADLLPVR